MTASKTFMKGHWSDLIISNFEVDKSMLEPYLPTDTEIDFYNDKAILSMVAFRFTKVSFFGVKIPFHQNFGQINFRFYVKSNVDGTKGVVFIKEFAAKPLIATIARLFYNEPYHFKNITYTKIANGNKAELQYSYKQLKIKAKGEKTDEEITKNDLESFVVNRNVAFIKSKTRKTVLYTIEHKTWLLYKLNDSNFNIELLDLLPKTFKNLTHIGTCFVDGSSVEVQQGVLQSS